MRKFFVFYALDFLLYQQVDVFCSIFQFIFPTQNLYLEKDRAKKSFHRRVGNKSVYIEHINLCPPEPFSVTRPPMRGVVATSLWIAFTLSLECLY